MINNPDLTIIGIVHDLNIAANYANNLLLIEKGKVLSIGSPSEVLTTKNIFISFNLYSKSFIKDNKTYLFFE